MCSKYAACIILLQKLFTHLCSFMGFVYEQVCREIIGNSRKVKFFSRRREIALRVRHRPEISLRENLRAESALGCEEN